MNVGVRCGGGEMTASLLEQAAQPVAAVAAVAVAAADANATPTDDASTCAAAFTAGDTTGLIDIDPTLIDAMDTTPIDAAEGLMVRPSCTPALMVVILTRTSR
jgi:hypothetical protein